MLNSKVRDNLVKLCEKSGGHIAFNYSLKEKSTISIGGEAAVWYEPSSLEGLKPVRSFLYDSDIKMMVIGHGSNILIPDKGLDMLVLRLSNAFFKRSEIRGKELTAGGGASLAELISITCKRGLMGLEGLVGIPATVGGALVTNASYKTSLSENLLRVHVLDAMGKERWIEREKTLFCYRSSSFKKDEIILEAVFQLNEAPQESLNKRLREYFLEKMEKQPLDKKTLGCVFKNPEKSEYAHSPRLRRGSGSIGDKDIGELTAGQLIDKLGLKGKTNGGAKVSEKHANFIVNTGNASSEDVVKLMSEIRERVREEFGVVLEPEIEVL